MLTLNIRINERKKKDKWRLIERKICGCIFILKSANLSNDDNSILYVKCK